MNKQDDYGRRLEDALTFIATHLDEELSLEQIARVACFSPFHFHRIYAAMVGETVSETVKRLRLHRAAGELLHEDRSIDRIARRAGYTSQSAFTRAFRTAYGIPPARYRGQTLTLQNQMKGDPHMYEVTRMETEALPVACLDHRGEYTKIGTAFEKLMMTAFQRGLVKGPPRTFGVYHDDPKSVEQDQLRSQACLMVDADWKATEPLGASEIKAGTYVCIEHIGPYAELPVAYDWLFGTWLPESGEEPDDRPVVEEYLNNPRETPANELRTMIWLPIR